MKKLAGVFMILFIVACGGNNEEKVKKQIISKKEQIASLNQEIKNLNKELTDTSGKPRDVIPVVVKKMEPETFNHFVSISGSAESVNQAYISPETGGQIQEIQVEEGDKVQKGDLLVRLNTDVTQSNIDEVQSNLDLAKKIYKKQDTLWKQNIGSEVEYLQAKNNYYSLKAKLNSLRAQLDMSLIRAPFSGIVDQIYIKDGEMASPGMRLIQLVNLSRMKVVGEISERYLPNIEKGQLLTVRFPSYTNITIDAPIHRTSNVINPANRTFTIEVRFNNLDNKIKPNMMAVMEINDFSMDSAMIVPSNIIKKDIVKSKKGDFKKFLFVVRHEQGNKTAKKVYIETGRSYDNQTIVTEGLKNGDQVIIEGYNTVSTGTIVQVKNTKSKQS